jgi:ICE2
VTLVASLGLFLTGAYWLYRIYKTFTLSLVSSALVSSSLTLFAILSAAAILSDDAFSIISDPALLFIYIVYNMWIILRDTAYQSGQLTRGSLLWPTDPWTFEFSFAWPVRYELGAITDLVQSYSVEIILNLVFRTAVYLLSAKMVQSFQRQVNRHENYHSPHHESDDSETSLLSTISEEDDWTLMELTLSDLLFAFGKCAILLMYTFSWVESHEGPSNAIITFFKQLPFLAPMATCRWLNIYWVLALYFYKSFYSSF